MPPISPFPPFRPGPLTPGQANELNRLAHEVEKARNLSVTPPLQLDPQAGGDALSVVTPDRFPAYITARNGYAHSWSEARWLGGGVYTPATNPRTGDATSSPMVSPAYERNNFIYFPADGTLIAWLTPAFLEGTATGQEYEFEFDGNAVIVEYSGEPDANGYFDGQTILKNTTTGLEIVLESVKVWDANA